MLVITARNVIFENIGTGETDETRETSENGKNNKNGDKNENLGTNLT